MLFGGQVVNSIHTVVRIRRVVVFVLVVRVVAIGRVVVGQGSERGPPGRTAGHRRRPAAMAVQQSRVPLNGRSTVPFTVLVPIRSRSLIFGVAMAALLLPLVAARHCSMPGSAGKALFLQLVHPGTGEGNSLSVDGGAVADLRNSRPGRAVPTDNLVRSVWLQSDQVHAAWTATHPGNRHPGANACQAAFDQVRTGTGVTVQPAVVMDTADGGCLLSDILEQTPGRA